MFGSFESSIVCLGNAASPYGFIRFVDVSQFSFVDLHMKKRVEAIEVTVDGDMVHISQPDPAGNEDHYVSVTGDQLVLLIEWLREARDKIRGESTD